MSALRVVVVEDSLLARGELREMLAEIGNVVIAAEAGNVVAGVQAVEREQPQVLLLDIQLPDGDGFALLEQLTHVPEVIFITAFDQYALRAFQVNALDYLQKPVEGTRLRQALERVRARLDQTAPPTTQGLTPQPMPAPARKSRSEQIFIRDGERCYFVRLADVSLFEVDGNYTRVYFGDQRPLLARALGYLEDRLEPSQFFRVSRRHIVNLEFIQRIANDVGDGLILTLRGGRTIEASRRQARELRALLEF